MENLSFSLEELKEIDQFAKDGGSDLWRDLSLLWTSNSRLNSLLYLFLRLLLDLIAELDDELITLCRQWK